MKKIDMFVFSVNIICTIAVLVMFFLSLTIGSETLLNSVTFVDIIGGLIIFGRFMYDKDYKIQYYIGFVFFVRAFSKVMDIVMESYVVDIASLVLFTAIIGIISSIFAGWIYQYFKEMSYRKNNSLEELNL